MDAQNDSLYGGRILTNVNKALINSLFCNLELCLEVIIASRRPEYIFAWRTPRRLF